MDKTAEMYETLGINKKVADFCREAESELSSRFEKIDRTDYELLRRLVSDRGKILQRRVTGTKAIYQRELAVAIKRARHMALLPFVRE